MKKQEKKLACIADVYLYASWARLHVETEEIHRTIQQ